MVVHGSHIVGAQVGPEVGKLDQINFTYCLKSFKVELW